MIFTYHFSPYVTKKNVFIQHNKCFFQTTTQKEVNVDRFLMGIAYSIFPDFRGKDCKRGCGCVRNLRYKKCLCVVSVGDMCRYRDMDTLISTKTQDRRGSLRNDTTKLRVLNAEILLTRSTEYRKNGNRKNTGSTC